MGDADPQHAGESRSTTPSGERSAVRRWQGTAVVRDVLLVVLGAILAFGVEELRDTRRRHARIAESLASIRTELVANIALVDSARVHHGHVIDTLQYYRTRHELLPLSVVYAGVFNPATVSGVAWQSARESGVLSDMDYGTILLLAPAYESQSRYQALADAVTQSLENDVRREGMERVMQGRFAQFIDLATDFRNRERGLLDRYRATLRALDGAPRQ